MHLGVFGLSGAGKTTLTNVIAERHLEVSVTSASKLIREFGGGVDYECLNIDRVRYNQDILVRAYCWYKNKHPHTLIELHNAVETKDGVEFVDPSIILALDLNVVFFLQAPAEEIVYRLLTDDSKRRRIATTSDLGELQDLALRHLQDIFGYNVLVLRGSNAAEEVERHLNLGLN